MIGLPSENFEDLKNTVNFINSHNIQGLKIHCTYVVENTVLADLLHDNKYEPISLDYYLECVSFVLSHISPEIVIHRITGDPKIDDLVEPHWLTKKFCVLNDIDKEMVKRNTYQGIKANEYN